MVYFCIVQQATIPFFFQVSAGGGIPLESHTRLISVPSITVTSDSSAESLIVGGTETH